ncbi:PEGA domain-containing protein [Patescibacteria group bacterium]|nr:MAG: PEGA domain-containing protein [Patescibacteria group bacterium]
MFPVRTSTRFMKNYLLALVAVVMVSLSTGCVAAERTSFTTLPIRSTPSGAVVKTNGVVAGVTPLTLVLPRGTGKKGKEIAVSITLEKYEPVEVAVKSGLSLEGFRFLAQRFPASFVFGKPAVEPGSARDLIPRQIDVVLTPLRPSDQAR